MNHRNPSAAPASAAQKTVNSPDVPVPGAPGRKYTPTYRAQSKRPNTYAKIPNAPAAIAVSPVASPSSPSVRFTAFELPVTTNVTNSTYTQGQNRSNWYLKSGTCVEAGGRFGASGHSSNTRPSASPKDT